MVLMLGEELAATREQLHALIAFCETGTTPAEALEAFVPDEQFDLERAGGWPLEPLEKMSSQSGDA